MEKFIHGFDMNPPGPDAIALMMEGERYSLSITPDPRGIVTLQIDCTATDQHSNRGDSPAASGHEPGAD
jgi:hypothetical protein